MRHIAAVPNYYQPAAPRVASLARIGGRSMPTLERATFPLPTQESCDAFCRTYRTLVNSRETTVDFPLRLTSPIYKMPSRQIEICNYSVENTNNPHVLSSLLLQSSCAGSCVDLSQLVCCPHLPTFFLLTEATTRKPNLPTHFPVTLPTREAFLRTKTTSLSQPWPTHFCCFRSSMRSR